MESAKTIIFIHGLWMHSSSWKKWMDYFNEQGYKTLSPGWPGDAETVIQCRENPQSIANRGVTEIVNRYAKIITSLAEPPIVIGHSFGGLIAQILLGQNLVSGCIAINPAPVKGVISKRQTHLLSNSFVMGLQMPFRKMKHENSMTVGLFQRLVNRFFKLQPRVLQVLKQK
jgi:non-heme chloroperoxidase